MSEGWVCPVCGGVNGPMVARCPCNGNRNYGVTTSTSTAHVHDWDYSRKGYGHRAVCRVCGRAMSPSPFGGFSISKMP